MKFKFKVFDVTNGRVIGYVMAKNIAVALTVAIKKYPGTSLRVVKKQDWVEFKYEKKNN